MLSLKHKTIWILATLASMVLAYISINSFSKTFGAGIFAAMASFALLILYTILLPVVWAKGTGFRYLHIGMLLALGILMAMTPGNN